MDWKNLKYDLEEKWERLELRRRINDRPIIAKIMVLGSISILLIVVLSLIWPQSARKYSVPKKVWYYDLNTGKLFVGDAEKNPPIKAPSGPLPNGELAGVLAHVYKSNYDKNAKPFIAFVEKLTAEAKKTRPVKLGPSEERTEREIKQWNAGRLIKRIDDEDWVQYTSGQGQAILKEAEEKIQSSQMVYCYPEKNE